MRVDPFSQYNVISTNQSSESEENPKKHSSFVPIIIVILLFLLLGFSVYMLGTRTSFFNFASGITAPEKENNVATTKPSPTASTESKSSTTTEISTNSATVVVPVTVPTSTPASVSIENSYMFASPLTAATGNVEKIRVTVFILDGTGAGVSGKIITLKGVENLGVTTVLGTTDMTGKAIFDVAAGTSGSYKISAEVGGVTLAQSVTVTFE